MRGKYIKWAAVCLVLSIITGAAAYYVLKPYFFKANPFQHLSKPNNQETGESPKVVPFPDWKERTRQRGVAVVIDNTVEARPQSGLDQAEVVVEFPVEGGLTRLLAIMSDDNIELVGPIRSARPYIVYLAQEYNSILVHAGGSDEALELIAKEKIDHLDEILGGVQVGAAFWRVPDRPKPYNLYASSDSLRRVGNNLKMNMTTPPTQHPVLEPDAEVEGESTDDITIYYPNRTSLVRYLFNKDAGIYERYMEEKPHLTAKGEQIATANIIVRFVPFRCVDGDGHLQLIMHGEGKTLVFRDGKVVEGLWKKAPNQFTKYTDKNGKTIPLVQGPTWIELVPNGTRIDY